MEQLTCKLCWLLAVVGMFCGDDITCIDLAHKQFKISSEVAILPITLPKEKHCNSQICKFMTIQAHTNPALCPVAVLQEYLLHLPLEDELVPHHKDPGIFVHPLVCDRCNLCKSVSADTINRHISTITNLLEQPSSSSCPCAQAIRASVAFKNGVSKDNIMVQANWSSSLMFDSFYWLSSMMATNFLNAVLS